LLSDAGFAAGVTIACFSSQREDHSSIMMIVQEQLRKEGIRLEMRIVDHATMHADNRRDLNAIALLSSSYSPVPTQVLVEQLSS
jgi:peptide/nickel transport system substrate-binding protein